MAEYPDFEKVCGYGSVTGIGGANCRHSYWPFIEGVSERTYTDSELEAMKPENRPKIEFEGRKYDDYQATQKQRQIERTVRKLKRRKVAFEAAGLTEDAQAASIRLRRLNAEYRAFSRAAGLPEQRERMRVLDGYKVPSHGQSAGNGGTGQLGEPVQVGTVDFSNKRAVMIQMDDAQAETAALEYEVNRTVTTDGKVWKVVGGSGEVHPETIPSNLNGSYSYHNHPAAKTWFSFSAEDVRFFFESGAAYAKASDYLFEYIIQRTPETLAVLPEMVYNDFNKIYWSDVMELAFNEIISADIDACHETMLRLSRKYKFSYERRRINGG